MLSVTIVGHSDLASSTAFEEIGTFQPYSQNRSQKYLVFLLQQEHTRASSRLPLRPMSCRHQQRNIIEALDHLFFVGYVLLWCHRLPS